MGFPKTVMGIDADYSDTHATFVLRDGASVALRVVVPRVEPLGDPGGAAHLGRISRLAWPPASQPRAAFAAWPRRVRSRRAQTASWRARSCSIEILRRFQGSGWLRRGPPR